MPIALYPNTSKPEVRAHLKFDAMSAEEFKGRYGSDVENALQTIQDVEMVRAFYENGGVEYKIEFDWGVDSTEAKSDVKVVVDSFQSRFPDTWPGFYVDYSGQYSSRFFVTLRSSEISRQELTAFVKNNVEPRLNGIDGIAAVWYSDWDTRQVEITMRPDQLVRFGITFEDLYHALKQHEFDTSLGVLQIEQVGSYQITSEMKFDSIDDLKETVVGYREKLPIKLRNVAEVSLKRSDPEQTFKSNGQETLIVGGYAQPDANIKAVADEFRNIVFESVKELDSRVEVKVLMDPAKFINSAIHNVLFAVIAGMLIATLVVFLFLKSFRNTLVICISIPLSLFGGITLMTLLGIEINLISLGAMALAVGMVVDGSIVVLENISRHFDMLDPSASVGQRLETIVRAVLEVRGAVVASLLTTIIVFAPLPFTSPIAAAILGDLAVVMVCVLVVSVLVTLFIIPPIVFLLRGQPSTGSETNRIAEGFNSLFQVVHLYYLENLEKFLTTRKRTLVLGMGVVTLLTIGAFLLVTQVKREVMATPTTDIVFVYFDFQDPNIPDEERAAIIDLYEKKGRALVGQDLSHTLLEASKRNGWIMFFLKDKSQSRRVKQVIESSFSNSPLFRLYIREWTPTRLRIPNPPVVRMNVLGHSEEDRRDTLARLEDIADRFDQIGRRSFFPGARQDDFFRFDIDDQKLARLREESAQPLLDRGKILQTATTYLEDQELYEVNLGGEDMVLRIKLPEGYFSTPEDMRNILMRVGNSVVPLKAFATLKHTREWAEYFTENGRDVSYVELWPKHSFEGDEKKLEQEIRQSVLKDPQLSRDSVSFVATDAEINENINSLVVALGLALVLICIVITLQFGQLVQTGVIMLAIPLGFIGVSFSLWVFSSTLSVNSMLGLILLCGTAVNNSILFVDFYNQTRIHTGSTVLEALMETAKLRFRPIMITTMTTILGMLPIALGWGSGGEILQPLGVAVCGGLWISTLLTVMVVPIAILAVEGLKKRFMAKKVLATSSASFVILLTFCLPTDVFAEQVAQIRLSVDQAVERAISAHSQVKIAKAQVRNATNEKRALYSELLPTVKVARTYSETEVEYEQGNTLGKSGKETIKFGQNTLTIQETLPNPGKYWNQLHIADNNVSVAESELRIQKHQIVSRTRAQYFAVQAATLSLDNARKNLKLAKDNLEVTRRRYQGGYVHRSDADRSEVNYKLVEALVNERQEALRLEMDRLRALLVLDYDRHIRLMSELPEAFVYFEYPPNMLWEKVSGLRSQRIAQLQAIRENASYSSRNARLNFLPDVNLSATYTRDDPKDSQDEPYRSKGPSYLLGLEWEVFSGGKSYFEFESALARQVEASEKLRQEQINYRVDLRRLVNRLYSLRTQFKIQQSNVAALNKIYEASQDRFKRGLVDSKQVNDDFKAYLDQQDRLVEFSLTIIETVADLAAHVNNDALFSELIGT